MFYFLNSTVIPPVKEEWSNSFMAQRFVVCKNNSSGGSMLVDTQLAEYSSISPVWHLQHIYDYLYPRVRSVDPTVQKGGRERKLEQ